MPARVLCLAIVLGFTSLARANLLLYEPFDYTAGTALTGQTDTYVTPNQTWAATGAYVGTPGGPLVGSTSLSLPGSSYPNYPSSIGNDANTRNVAGDSATPRISLNAAIGTASGVVYYSVLVNAANVNVGNGTAGSFIAGFNNTTGSQSAAQSTIGAAICIHANSGGYSFGIVNTNTATRAYNDTKVFGTADTVLIVASYTYGSGTADDVANLYINPDASFLAMGSAEGPPPTPDATFTGDMGTPGSDTIRTFFVRDNTSEPTGGMFMDEIRVATTWAEAAIPEPASTLLLGAIVVLPILRRRRRRADRAMRCGGQFSVSLGNFNGIRLGG
jgi:hypothetical protein